METTDTTFRHALLTMQAAYYPLHDHLSAMIGDDGNEYGDGMRPVLTEQSIGADYPVLVEMLARCAVAADACHNAIQAALTGPTVGDLVAQVEDLKARLTHASDTGFRESLALDEITLELDGIEWDADTLDRIAAILRRSGRTIRESDGSDPFAERCGECGDVLTDEALTAGAGACADCPREPEE